MTAGGSVARWGREGQQAARKGVWRKVLAWLRLSPAARRADARAAACDIGAVGERATAVLLAPLEAQGWHVRHDLRPPGGRRNYDHVLVSPCGRAVIVLDSKQWRRNWPTTLQGGRVHCGPQDRHDQILKAAGHAREVQEYLDVRGLVVLPLLVVHGSPVTGGRLGVRVPGWADLVWVLGADRLVPTLLAAPRGVRDARRARQVAARVDAVLAPYR